ESAANDIVVSLAGPARRDEKPGRNAAGEARGSEASADVEQLGSWQELASVTLPSGEVIGYGLVGARPVLPTVKGSVAIYRNVLPHTDIEVVSSPAGMKETIVLKSPQAATSWVFPL